MDTPLAGSTVLHFPKSQVDWAHVEPRVGVTDAPDAMPGGAGAGGLTPQDFGRQPAGSPSPSAMSADRLSDLESLLRSVTHRLRLTVDATATRSTSAVFKLAESEMAESVVRTRVLECAHAIDQLTSNLAAELRRIHRFEMELSSVRVALAQSQDELARSQAGIEQAVHEALHDGLTALPNRRHFHQHIGRSLALPEPACPAFVVLCLDLDGFKSINDAHGHEAGDEVLRIIAARLRHAVRAADMVSRIGGDEFACLLADAMPRDHVIRLVGKIYDALSSPLNVGGARLSVRPSIGIATCPADGTTAAHLLCNADAAMYLAKRRQSGHAFFDEVGADT